MTTSEQKRFFEKVDSEIKDDRFLGKGIITIANKISSSRAAMLPPEQTKTPEFAEKPNVFTNYEDKIGAYSNSFKEIPEDCEVVAKIKKYDNLYVLITKDDNNHYEMYFRTDATHLTEKYAYRHQNEVIDSLKVGDKLEQGEILYRSTAFNQNMQYGYGVNGNVIYLAHPPTIEDAIECSIPFSEKAATNSVVETIITYNNNDLLVNLFGDNKNYKCFPDIGEEVYKGKVLAARRRLDYETALIDLKNQELRDINPNIDTVFYAKGKVIDVDIYSNTTLSKLEENPYNTQIVRYLKKQDKFHRKLYKVLKEIINDKNATYCDDIGYWYSQRLRPLLEEGAKWSDDKNDFDNLTIVIKTMKCSPLVIGSKISGRYGDKGVVSSIVPPEVMPTITLPNGTKVRADLILNAFGVYNRTNPAQLFEVELNYCASLLVDQMQGLSTEEKCDLILRFFKIVNKTQYKFLKSNFKKMSKKDFKLFFDEIDKYGLFIHQPPFFGNVNIDEMMQLYEEFGFEKSICYRDGQRMRRKQIIAKKYIIILKHDPYGKFSSRSSAFLSLKNIPSKELTVRQGVAQHSKTPVQNGEMETFNRLISGKPYVVANNYNKMSTSETARASYIDEQITGNPLNFKTTSSAIVSDNFSRLILDVLLKSISLKINVTLREKE